MRIRPSDSAPIARSAFAGFRFPSDVNDAGHGGVADVTAVLFSLQTPSGAAAGQGWVSCVNILATDQLCHAAFVLTNGQIEAQAEIPMTATTFTAAITGGTGAFAGSAGRSTTSGSRRA